MLVAGLMRGKRGLGRTGQEVDCGDGGGVASEGDGDVFDAAAVMWSKVANSEYGACIP